MINYLEDKKIYESSELDSYASTIGDLSSRVEALESADAELQSSVEGLQSRMSAVETEGVALQESIAALEERIAALEGGGT